MARSFSEEKGVEVNENEENIQDRHDFMELFEESMKSMREGKVVKGEIVQIGREFVLVDIGYKSEGQIRIGEFTNLRGRLTAKVGDEIDVVLVRKENKEGRIILSKEKAAGVKLWDKIEECFRKQDMIRGK
jgi:small subunit ribosomal protein S1